MLVKRDHFIAAQPPVLSTWGMMSGVSGVVAQPIRGKHLTGRDGITGQQQVTSFLVKLLRAQHGTLGHALPPLQVRGGRDRTQVAELDGVTAGSRSAAIASRTDDLPAPLAPDSRSNIASIMAVLATDLTPRAMPSP